MKLILINLNKNSHPNPYRRRILSSSCFFLFSTLTGLGRPKFTLVSSGDPIPIVFSSACTPPCRSFTPPIRNQAPPMLVPDFHIRQRQREGGHIIALNRILIDPAEIYLSPQLDPWVLERIHLHAESGKDASKGGENDGAGENGIQSESESVTGTGTLPNVPQIYSICNIIESFAIRKINQNSDTEHIKGGRAINQEPWFSTMDDEYLLRQVGFESSPQQIHRHPIAILSKDDSRAIHVRKILNKTANGESLKVGIINSYLTNARICWLDKFQYLILVFPPLPLQNDPYRKQDLSSCLEANGWFPASPPSRIHILLAMPRPKVLNRLIPTLASLGVDSIFLTAADRVENTYFCSRGLRDTELRSALLEGLMQAGCDTRIPNISIYPKGLKQCLTDPKVVSLAWVAEEGAQEDSGHNSTTLLKVVAHLLEEEPEESGKGPSKKFEMALSNLHPGGNLLIAIGPEGGWLDHEIDHLLNQGFQAVTLGPRALRTDAACVSFITLAYHCMSTTNRG